MRLHSQAIESIIELTGELSQNKEFRRNLL